MVREEKIIIGTQEELRDYYLEKLNSKEYDEEGKVISYSKEYTPFNIQIEEVKKNNIGILYYFKVDVRKPSLTLEKIFVFLEPKTYTQKGEGEN